MIDCTVSLSDYNLKQRKFITGFVKIGQFWIHASVQQTVNVMQMLMWGNCLAAGVPGWHAALCEAR